MYIQEKYKLGTCTGANGAAFNGVNGADYHQYLPMAQMEIFIGHHWTLDQWHH
jgi:hypothetical protein